MAKTSNLYSSNNFTTFNYYYNPYNNIYPTTKTFNDAVKFYYDLFATYDKKCYHNFINDFNISFTINPSSNEEVITCYYESNIHYYYNLLNEYALKALKLYPKTQDLYDSLFSIKVLKN